MAATYKGPSENAVSEIRFLIGDTDVSKANFQDEELQYLIDKESSTLYAAARAADVLAARFSGGVKSKSADGKSITYDKSSEYAALAKSLRTEARRGSSAIPYSGGTSKADKETVEQDQDRDAPAFERGMHDRFGTETSPLEAGPVP